MNWIWFRGSVFAKAEQSWEKWWYEEQDHLRNTGIWGKIMEIILDLRFFFFQYGIVYQLNIAAGSTSIAVYLLSWIYIFVAFAIYAVIAFARDKYAAKEHKYYRQVQFLVIILAILVIIALLQFTAFTFIDIFTSLLAFIPTGWGLILIAQVLRPFLRRGSFSTKHLVGAPALTSLLQEKNPMTYNLRFDFSTMCRETIEAEKIDLFLLCGGSYVHVRVDFHFISFQSQPGGLICYCGRDSGHEAIGLRQ
nr:callose synthase 12 [Quercus suber]